MNKKPFIILSLIIVILIAGCSNSQDEYDMPIDSKCREIAIDMLPEKLSLVFKENNGDNIDSLELDYFLEHIKFTNNFQMLQDRGFHRPKNADGRNMNYYYPFDSRTKTDEAWPHTEKIQYKKEVLSGGEVLGYNIFEYEFALFPTDNVTYDRVYNDHLQKFEDTTKSGKREFIVRDIEIIRCIYLE